MEIKLSRRVLLRLNHGLHAINATPARPRGGVNSSPLDRARTAASSPRNDFVKNCRVHPTHWLISTQVEADVARDAALFVERVISAFFGGALHIADVPVWKSTSVSG